MKYLLIIFAIIATAAIISLTFFRPEKPTTQEDIALTVNGHNISNSSISQESNKFGYHGMEKQEIYDSVITREILINEAQRQKIDKEDDFRKALKIFYETSLIKILLERENSKIQVSVSDEEIENYLSYIGKTVSFTRLDSIPTPGTDTKKIAGNANTALFDDLAEPLRLLLSTLQPGSYGIRFDTGTEKYALRLDSVNSINSPTEGRFSKQHIRDMISDYKHEQFLNQWLTDLKAKAEVTIHN